MHPIAVAPHTEELQRATGQIIAAPSPRPPTSPQA
jgi:hypothetical protein